MENNSTPMNNSRHKVAVQERLFYAPGHNYVHNPVSDTFNFSLNVLII